MATQSHENSGAELILEIVWNDLKFEVELIEEAGSRRVRVGGRDVNCDWVSLPDGRHSLIHDSRVLDLSILADGLSCLVQGRDGHFIFKIHDPRRMLSAEETEDPGAGPARLCAEMPGKVVRVLVKEGDAVQYEQALVVLEAMKMQNEIRSPKSGKVIQLGVQEGRAVSSGDFLVSIE